jgi:cell division protein ZapE
LEDTAQNEAALNLDKLYKELVRYDNVVHSDSLLALINKHLKLANNVPKGMYLYGPVGRGKSFLMDMLFNDVDFNNKKRVHFQNFISEIHLNLKAKRGKNKRTEETAQDVIELVAKELAEQHTLICLDEFYINDVTDAIIMAKVFRYLFENGVVVVITSNRAPEELYKSSVELEYFRELVAQIKKHLVIFELNAANDYRTIKSRNRELYVYPLKYSNDKKLDEILQIYLKGEELKNFTINLSGSRTVDIDISENRVASSNFNNLCANYMGSDDYRVIAESVRVLCLRDIPKLTYELRNEAQRFIMLVDQLYELRRILICSSEVALDNLYESSNGSQEFLRTISRIKEMHTSSYTKS